MFLKPVAAVLNGKPCVGEKIEVYWSETACPVEWLGGQWGFEVRRPPGKWCSLWVFYFIDNWTPHPSANTSSHSSPSPIRSPRTHKHTLFFWIDGWIMGRLLRCGQVETRVLVSDVCLCWRWGPMWIFLHPMWFFLWSPQVLCTAVIKLQQWKQELFRKEQHSHSTAAAAKNLLLFRMNIQKQFSTGTIFYEYHTLSFFFILTWVGFFFRKNIAFILLLFIFYFIHSCIK